MLNFLQHIVQKSMKVVTGNFKSRLSGEVFAMLLALFVVTSISVAQDYTMNGNVVNNGTIRVRRDIINNTTGMVTMSGTGVIRQDRNVNNHLIRSTTGTYPITFANLSMTQTMTVTYNVDVTVTNNLTIGDATNPYTNAGTGFSIGARTLTINNLSSYLATSTAALTFSGGTVLFNGTASQFILNKASGVTYGTLSLSGAGAKSVTTGGTVTAATLIQAGGSGQISVTENTNVTGTASITDLGVISAGKTLQLTAAVTSASITAMNNTGTGILQNAANITTTISTLTGNAGTINQSGASGTIAFTNAAINAGTITTATGTFNFNNNLSGAGTITLSGNGNVLFGGSVAQTTYNLNNGTTTYNSATAGQSIIGTIYNNLTLTSNSKTAAGVMTVNGNLSVSGGTFTDAGFQITGNATGTLSMAAGTGLTLGSAGTGTSFPANFTNAHITLDATNTVTYNSDQAQSVSSAPTYGNIVFSGTGMKTFTASTTAAGNVTVNSGAQVTVNNSVTVQVNGSTNLAGNVTNNGVINVGP
jgi:hypothetical protein